MRARLLARKVFMPSPRKGVAVCGAAYYTRPSGGDLIGYHVYATRSDTVDVQYLRYSADNGRTWSAPVERATGAPQAGGGMLRRHPRGGYVDPQTGLYFSIWTEGVLPSDNPLEGLKRWILRYAVSADGGRTNAVEEQIVHAGAEYDPAHPLPGVWVGKNSVMLGDLTCRPVTLADGTLLVPCQLTLLGPDGEYYNPGGGYTYHAAAVLRGRWRPDRRLEWTLSSLVTGDAARTTRGLIEPTIAPLDDGRILMVMRGSNDVQPHLPGYKWRAFSADGGQTWTPPEPWTCADGGHFHSPSSCSQLLRHSNGALLWLGNLCAANPHGNAPRYPFVVGAVDRRGGGLLRDSVAAIDDRAPDESERLTLSNFYAREDRETGHILLYLTRLFARQPADGPPDWTADALEYRIALDAGGAA
jgi:hypothetical protein